MRQIETQTEPVAQSGATARIAVAEIAISFEFPQGEQTPSSIPAHHRPFLSAIDPTIRLRCRRGLIPPDLLDRNRVLFDTGWMWSVHQAPSGLTWREMSASVEGPPYRVAALERDLSSGTVYLQPQSPYSGYPLRHPLEKFLFGALLAQGRGLTLHACGLAIGGKGLLFVGQSGAGKSTMADLWQRQPGTSVLSDERIIVRGDGSRFRIYGTPWYGTAGLSSPASADLAAVFLLRHGSMNMIEETQDASVVRQLLPCAYLPFWSPEGMDFSLAFLGQLSHSVPCYELTFVPDDRIIKLLRDF